MSHGIRVRVWGEYALFCRPEMKVERCSYDIMTPSAARGILDAIYYHPGIKWKIDKIYICRPIAFTNIRRNEIKSKILCGNALNVMNGGKKSLFLSIREEIVQRASLLLRDVEYVIDAHFQLTKDAAPGDNPGKFKDIMQRRLQNGRCYHQPYLGTREFPARFALCEEKTIKTAYEEVEEKDLGFMLYDFDYHDDKEIGKKEIEPMFFRAILRHGVLDLAECEVIR